MLPELLCQKQYQHRKKNSVKFRKLKFYYLQGDQAANDGDNLYLHLRCRLFKATFAETYKTRSQFIFVKKEEKG